MEPQKNLQVAVFARQIYVKKRNLHGVNEYFEHKFNDAKTKKLVFQRFPI
jgi:Na+/proline symporter